MSAQVLLVELKKWLPLKVYGNGPILELLREMGRFVDKKTSLKVTDVFKAPESGEIICTLTLEDGERVTAALSNLKLEITHPLFRKVKNYRNDVADTIVGGRESNVNQSSFRIRDLYKK